MAKNLGNPALIAAAASSPEVRAAAPVVIRNVNRSAKIGLIAIASIAGILIVRTGIRAYQRSRINNHIADNPNYRAAQSIYDAIPAGLKKGDGSLLNPFGFISDIGNQIALIWQSTDSQRILDVGRTNITDFNETAKAFKVLYRQDLVELLRKVMNNAELEVFYQHTTSWKAAKVESKAVEESKVGYRAVSTKESHLISMTYNLKTKKMSGLKFLSPNVPAGVSLGTFMGKSYKNVKEGDTDTYLVSKFATSGDTVYYLGIPDKACKLVPMTKTSSYKKLTYSHNEAKVKSIQ